MIVQIHKSKDGEVSVYMISQDVGEQRDLQLLTDALEKGQFLGRDSHVLVPNGADNVLLVTSKGNVSGRA